MMLKRKYTANQGGHALGHLRGALMEALDAGGKSWWNHIEMDFYDSAQQARWNRLDKVNQARWLLGQLWNCTDILSGQGHDIVEEYDPMNDAKVTTYGRLARFLKHRLPSQ